MIRAETIDYVGQVFGYVKTALASAFGWFTDILEAVGLPWRVFSLILIGFAVAYLLVSGIISSYRDSADSVFSDSVQASRRIQARTSRERYLQAYSVRTKQLSDHNKDLLRKVSVIERRSRK